MDQESKKDTILARYQDALAEISRLKEVLYQYKEYDILTGLYNKSTFETKVRNLLDHAQNAKYAIICADIEQFKVINDLYGIKKGDDILRHIGKSLWSLFYPKDWIVARFSADMFLMCVPEERKEDVVVHILELFNEMEIKITPAIGVYTIADKTMPIPYMCDNALMALKSIKQNYRIHYAMFQEDMRTKIVSEQEILDHAQEALNKRYFQVYIQPKCDMQTGKIVGGEALVRWIDPENGMIMPKEFIPLFERNGFIKEMDLYVWKEVAKWMQSLIARGIQPVPISVNVSRVDIMEMNVYEIFQNLIEQYWLEPSLLRIEVTESAYSNEEVLIIQEIDKMRKEGFIVLLDDFGSGYSSLNILKDINIDILKLDLHFLDKDNQKSRDIICSILNMTKWLKLNTIAEGVENATQVEFLLKIGCRFAQGYYYYKPMPIEKFEELLGESGRVEYEIENTLNQKKQMLINVKELFYENMISNSILNDVLGAVALLSYETEYVRLEKGNMQFFQMIEKDPEQVSNEENI
ncbi:MAG: bifunctional diguanylate cyclase/phosphodiesterase, partial [Lachnospiraceae bacterium]